VRPTTLKVGPEWTAKRYPYLGSTRVVETKLDTHAQALEKQKCYDLLDCLTKSGAMAIVDAQVHVVIAATHIFDMSVMDTLVKGNVNPIEQLERASVVMASAIHGVEIDQLTL
jgi:hypothetical protein